MDCEEIRARIAEIEVRLADEQHTDDHRTTAEKKADEDRPWRWNFLFEKAFDILPDSDGEDFSAGEWLSEGLGGLRYYLQDMGPDGNFWQQVHAAERTLLLAWRSLLNARLEQLEKKADDEPSGTARRQQIDIEFD
ncbi:MAG: hypothetical protein U9R25_10595 [Chloroflexota bacterium]|nr:hypothetical protein [Chloroflexota bacterium]